MKLKAVIDAISSTFYGLICFLLGIGLGMGILAEQAGINPQILQDDPQIKLVVLILLVGFVIWDFVFCFIIQGADIALDRLFSRFWPR